MATKPPKPEDIKAQYGFVALIAKAVPELGRLLERATKEQWTSDRFNMAVAGTKWWKSNSDVERQWFITRIADPATAQKELDGGGNRINMLASELGLKVDPAHAQRIWLYGKMNGYSDQDMKAYTFRAVIAAGGVPTGEVGGAYGQMVTNYRSLAARYGYMPKGIDGEVSNAVVDVLSAGGDVNDMAKWQQKLINYASAKYGAFAGRFKAGETVEDVASPYREAVADILELNPQDVGLDDKYVQRWLQGKVVDGKPTAPPVWQAQQELRKDERWQYTRNAWEQMAQTATQIGKAFGMVG